jgi:predicted ABC-type ATPase
MSRSFVASCTIIGGANGSGKSTIFEALHADGELVNADIVAREIAPDNPTSVSFQAGKRALQRLSSLIALRKSFIYETTLASHQSLRLMETARDAGYGVGLVFVVLRHPDLNVRRVAERVKLGGHSIPEDVIRRRYEGAFANFPKAIRLADQVIVYDNSESTGIEKLIQIDESAIVSNTLDEANLLHCRIAESVGSALNIGIDIVFKAAKPT